MAYLLALLMAIAPDDATKHAVKIQIDQPDRQLAALLKLFDGERVADPASALAAWRRANGNTKTPGKAIEAAVAAMNPGMVRELRSLDLGQLVVDFGPEKGEPRWFLRFPRDDGTLAAFATALALTGGASEPPMEGIQIDRLGPKGSPLMARPRDDGRPMSGREPVVIAGRREEIAAAFDHLPRRSSMQIGSNHGVVVNLDPELLARSGSLPVRQCAELFLGLGVGSTTDLKNYAQLQFHEQTQRTAPSLELIALNMCQGKGFPAKMDPSWLECLPGAASVAFAFAVDPRPEMWDTLFAALDRAEKADPKRAKAAPLRTRWNLLATAAGVRPEADLWPKLRGVSGYVSLTAKGSGKAESALLALHMTDEAASRKIASEFVPKVAKFLKLGPAEGGEIRTLGRVSGQPLRVTRKGTSVWLGWGEKSIEAAADAAGRPRESARGAFSPPWNDPKGQTSRLVAVWPGRLGIADAELEGAPPIVWFGATYTDSFVDRVIWPDLKTTLHNVLERLPMNSGK